MSIRSSPSLRSSMIAVGAGASGCLNMWWDADIDAVMARTRKRPIPAGTILPGEALAFGLTLAAGSVLMLGVVANWLAAGLLAFTIFFYVVIYSMWLKRSTPQNIVIGGAAGALPPIVGAGRRHRRMSASRASSSSPIIFVWTPPHFWALALVKSERLRARRHPDDAERRGPGCDAAADPRLHADARARSGCCPSRSASAASPMRAIATLGGAGMLALAWQVFRCREGERAMRVAQHLFGFLDPLSVPAFRDPPRGAGFRPLPRRCSGRLPMAASCSRRRSRSDGAGVPSPSP